MAGAKKVGIKELKNNLSAYVREVRRGAHILVTDRADVVAEIREPGAAYSPSEDRHPLLEAWARAGVVALPTRPKSPLPPPPARLPDGTAKRLLDADRSERRR
jgi:antitoxin (DNA-binding transcriptional repressor) of toxin-antitoxin stability system